MWSNNRKNRVYLNFYSASGSEGHFLLVQMSPGLLSHNGPEFCSFFDP